MHNNRVVVAPDLKTLMELRRYLILNKNSEKVASIKFKTAAADSFADIQEIDADGEWVKVRVSDGINGGTVGYVLR